MFGRKKETAPQPPFQVQVLTTEYFIEGTAKGNEQFYLPSSEDYWSPITLTDVRITSIHDENIPVRKSDRFDVQGGNVVAFIPLRDATTMIRFEVYEAYKKEMKGLYYVGPYLMEGTLKGFENDSFSSTLVMMDVNIRHNNPKSPFKEVQSPHILINTFWLHGRDVR